MNQIKPKNYVSRYLEEITRLYDPHQYQNAMARLAQLEQSPQYFDKDRIFRRIAFCLDCVGRALRRTTWVKNGEKLPDLLSLMLWRDRRSLLSASLEIDLEYETARRLVSLYYFNLADELGFLLP